VAPAHSRPTRPRAARLSPPSGDGLQLCYRIKQHVPAPEVVVFSAYASAELSLPATLAGADAVISKGVGARQLFDTIRRVHRGERLLEPLSASTRSQAVSRVPRPDGALIGMLLEGTTESDAASTLRLELRDVRHAIQRTLRTLRLDVPGAH
jgi:DNA-binding NarL/FixJ family response regulator